MYKKLRFYFRFLSALLSKYFRIILAGLIIGSLSFLFLPKIINRLPQIESPQKIALIGRHTISDLPISIQNKISLGLTTIQADGSPTPGIASSWEATDSGKTYIFTINSAKHWQDGTPIKSSDIRYAFKDAQIEYPDDEHLVIRLKDPFSPLPTVVSRPVFKLVKGQGFFNPPHLEGVGEYRLTKYHLNGGYVENLSLEPVSGDSSLKNLQYYFYSTPQNARTAFKLGLVNSIENISDLGELSHWPNTTIDTNTQSDRYVGIFFNTQDPAFEGQSGKNLRFALNYAIDKSRWPHRALGPINPKSWAFQPQLKTYDHDLDRAKTLLKNVEKIPDQITLSTVVTYLSTAELVKSDWETLGLKVNIQVSPEIPSHYQALLIAEAIPTDPDQYNLWHSTVDSTNLTSLKNPRIDKLLEDGRKTENQSDRQKIYADFQKFLLDENPAIFLYFPEIFTVTRK
jgi:peptide/nickel transport system substrate-binding protein